jgi:hypothetical protein
MSVKSTVILKIGRYVVVEGCIKINKITIALLGLRGWENGHRLMYCALIGVRS